MEIENLAVTLKVVKGEYIVRSEVTNDIIDKWIQDHIKDDGISVNDFELEEYIYSVDYKTEYKENCI